MTLFEQIQAIGQERAEATKDSEYAYLSSRLYAKADMEIDEDILKNDSQPGDAYVWALRGNGCGTDLTRFGNPHFDTFITQAPEGSEFYLLKCTGINEGTVQKITREKALDLPSMGIKANPERVPRRRHLYEQLDEMLGFGGKWSARDSLMGSEFSPEKGDKTAIRIQRDNYRKIAIDVIRINTHDHNGKLEKPSKPEARYYVPETATSNMDLQKPKYFAIDSDRSGFAKFTEISKRAFDNAVKKVRKSQESEHTL